MTGAKEREGFHPKFESHNLAGSHYEEQEIDKDRAGELLCQIIVDAATIDCDYHTQDPLLQRIDYEQLILCSFWHFF